MKNKSILRICIILICVSSIISSCVNSTNKHNAKKSETDSSINQKQSSSTNQKQPSFGKDSPFSTMFGQKQETNKPSEEEQLWQGAKLFGMNAYIIYLRKYPNGKYAEEATTEFKKHIRTGFSKQDCQKLLSSEPESEFAPIAAKQLKQLIAEECELSVDDFIGLYKKKYNESLNLYNKFLTDRKVEMIDTSSLGDPEMDKRTAKLNAAMINTKESELRAFQIPEIRRSFAEIDGLNEQWNSCQEQKANDLQKKKYRQATIKTENLLDTITEFFKGLPQKG